MIKSAEARKILPQDTEYSAGIEPHTCEACFTYIGNSEPMHEHERILQESVPVAYLYPVAKIYTDPLRFQNRTDHFSEQSANAVAENYNPNKFDPIVVWYDMQAGKVFVLSGHSRLEGMKRRKEKAIPARFFSGTESEATQFAKVEANRANTRETLTEDLKAYKLMQSKNATAKEMKEAFRERTSLLEQLAYLNPQSRFIEILGNEDIISQFPQIQRFAKWVGNLRKKYGNAFTNRHEADVFNFLYNGDAKHTKMPKEDFEELIGDRLATGKERLFPECPDGEQCKEVKDLKELPPNGHLYKQVSEISKDLEILKDRLNNNGMRDAYKVQTEEERNALAKLYQKLETKLKALRRDLGIIENYQDNSGLFGTTEEVRYIVYATEGKIKHRHFSNAPTIPEARKEARNSLGKKAKIEKTIKI